MPYGYGYGYNWNAWGWAMMAAMAFVWILFIAGFVLVIRWAWGRGGPLSGRVAHTETALDVLQKRYAAGEITAEQYREMKQELGSGGAAPA